MLIGHPHYRTDMCKQRWGQVGFSQMRNEPKSKKSISKRHTIENWIRQHSFSSDIITCILKHTLPHIDTYIHAHDFVPQPTLHSAVNWSSSVVDVARHRLPLPSLPLNPRTIAHTRWQCVCVFAFSSSSQTFGLALHKTKTFVLCVERAKKRARHTQLHSWASSQQRANGILFWYIIYPVFRIAHQFNERFRLNVMCGALNQWELRCTCSNEDVVESLRAVRKIWTNIFIGDLLLKTANHSSCCFSNRQFLFFERKERQFFFGTFLLCID